MKTPIKYLLLAAIVAFSFVKVFSKKNKIPIPPQATLTMPKIPNGDFEDWIAATSYGRKGYYPKAWEVGSPRGHGNYRGRYFDDVIPDTLTPFHGKYCALFMLGANGYSIFPISVHPSSLHAAVKSQSNNMGPYGIKVELVKNAIVVDSGWWHIDQRSIELWTEIDIPITNSTSRADSVRISIYNYSSKLWVDDLFFK